MSFFAGLYHPGEDRLYPPGDPPGPPAWRDGPLIPVYDFELLADSLPEPDALTGPDTGTLRRHSPLLPLQNPGSLEEGDLAVTPVEPAPFAGDEAVWKREDRLPGGTSLAREVALVHARSEEPSHTVRVGTGMPSRLRAHARGERPSTRHRILLVPDESTPLLEGLIKREGTVAVRLDGPRPEVQNLVDELLEVTDLVPLTPPQNPYGLEGLKTVAYEIIAQHESTPGTVVVPEGDGSLGYGVQKGFYELVRLGWIDHPPRVVTFGLPGDTEAGPDPAWAENRESSPSGRVAWPRMGECEMDSRTVDPDAVKQVHRTAGGPAGTSRIAALLRAGWESYRQDEPDSGQDPVVLLCQGSAGLREDDDAESSPGTVTRAALDKDSLLEALRGIDSLPPLDTEP